MKNLRYIQNVATLRLDTVECIGCTMCERVCPHQVFKVEKKKAFIRDKDGCMECGACSRNCPVGAISVQPGVGCASLIINRWLKRKNVSAGSCC